MLILGHQDSVGLAFTKALSTRIAADASGTNVRVTSQRDVDFTLMQGMPAGGTASLPVTT